METTAFYSYKGGAGRTALCTDAASVLAKQGKRVVVLDLDLDSPGLHYRIPRSVHSRTGVVDLLRKIVDSDRSPIERPPRNLLLIPAGHAPYPEYWAALGELRRLLRTSGSLLECVLELQARIAEELSADCLLIDCPSGISELGGVATLLADRVVCLTTGDQESTEGTVIAISEMKSAPRLDSQRNLSIEVVLMNNEPDLASAAETFGVPVSVPSVSPLGVKIGTASG